MNLKNVIKHVRCVSKKDEIKNNEKVCIFKIKLEWLLSNRKKLQILKIKLEERKEFIRVMKASFLLLDKLSN